MKNKKRGLFIVLDGIDGSGKATQTALLLERLEKAGYRAGTIDFPRYYDNFFGKLTGEYLTGSLGDVDPRLASVLYALDRWESKGEIEQALEAGKIFVCNRYMSANMIHQGGRIKSARKRGELMGWLEEMEFGVFGIPQPDLVLYLDVLPEVGRRLVGRKDTRAYAKGKKRDIHEKDRQHLIDARNQALRLAREKKGWKKIDCMRGKEIRTPDEVSELIWAEVAGRLGKK
jgi:dTMP kinase